MKQILLTIALLVGLASSSFAQTTAEDWQKSDCDGNPYGLYDMANQGNIVIMEFVMMNCGSCVTAANLLKNVVAEFEQSHPGRVKIFSVSFNNTTTCTALKTWKTNAGVTWPVIPNGKEILAQYGEMGMPTIAVVGQDKQVLYTSIGFSSAKVNALKTAISNGLSQASVKLDAAKSALYTLYPNPASNILRIETTSESPRSYQITDALGKVLLSGNVYTNEINTSSLVSGAYSVMLILADGTTISKQFTVTR
jgi:peroxiredoxin